MIPWAKPTYWGKEIEYANKALGSTWISGGPYVEQLEKEMRGILDVRHALAVSNGTTAIHLAYLGLGLQPGDEIIVPGFAFMAVANIALHMGVIPVFADIDEDTWCLTREGAEKAFGPGTKAIMPVHTY